MQQKDSFFFIVGCIAFFLLFAYGLLDQYQYRQSEKLKQADLKADWYKNNKIKHK